MENFVLYEELRQDSHSNSVVYKGRRRGTIEFVSIQCTEKRCRDQVTNSVRILHTFDHPNVVHFYEWYETDNHLWCIGELCTGGMLEDIIVQDGHLPEESIQDFGADLLAGLSYVHSMGVVLCDLNPAKILLDNNGVLKYFDFANARLPNNLDGQDGGVDNDPDDSELESTGNGTAQQEARYGLRHKQQIEESQAVIGNPLYMAPEVMQGDMCSSASDLWSLGCVMYELYYGIPPFSGQTFEEVLHRTLNEEVDEFPAVEDKVPPSGEFQDLLSGLLIKDPTRRMAWPELVSHPFWGDSLLLPGSIDTEEQNQKAGSNELRSTSGTGSKAKKETRINQPDERPLTAPFQCGTTVKEATFALSGTRPHSALPVTMVKPPEQKVQSCVSEQHQVKAADLSLKDQTGEAHRSDEAVLNVRKLLFHSSDLSVLPIFGNSKIHKMPSFKWDSKVLPFQAIEVDTLSKMDPAPLDGHLIAIERALVSSGSSSDTISPRVAANSSKATNSGTGSRGKLHIAAYLYCICQDTELANLVVNSPLFGVALSLLRAPKTPSDLKFRLVMILGSLARHSTLISQDLDLSEVIKNTYITTSDKHNGIPPHQVLMVLSELIKENFRNVDMKQVLVAALGEFVFYVASEEEREGKVLPRWKVPPSSYGVVARCLKEGEATATQLYAVKTIMNVASTGGRQCEPFTSCEIILTLWTIYLNCKQDAVKALSLSAISRLIRFDPILGQHLVERVGLRPVVSLLASPHSKFQQPVINLFNVMLTNNIAVRKLLVDKDFLSHTVQLLEHPSCLLRAKGYLTVALSAEHSSETLLSCCRARLVSCIDRDVRRQTSQSKSLDDSALYLIHCLDYLIATVLKLIPEITGGIVESLTAVSGRKHPSAAQSKVLRASLPLLPVLGYFASSSLFAAEMLTKSLLTSLATLLTHAAHISCGDAGLGSNAGLSNANFCDSVFDILEACLSSSHTTLQHTDIIMQELLPSVALFLQGGHPDAHQSLAAGLIGDTLNRVIAEGDRTMYCSGLQVLVRDCLSPSLPALMGHSGPSRLGALQLVATLVETDYDCLALVAQDVAVIRSLMGVLQECSSNVQLPSFLLVMTIIRHVSTSSHLDRDILHTAGFLSHMVSSLDQLTSAIFDQSQRLVQQQQILPFVTSTLECLSTQSEYLLVLQQHAREVGENRPLDKQMEAHSELLLCIPSLFELICLEDVGQSVGQCLLLLLQLYSHQFRSQFRIKEMKCLLSALESVCSADQEVVVLNVIKGLVNNKIVQGARHIQADNIKLLKQNVLRVQKRTSEKHIKKLTVDVLQLLTDIH